MGGKPEIPPGISGLRHGGRLKATHQRTAETNMKGILTGFGLLTLLAAAAMADEMRDRPVAFQIAAQSLDSALVEFSKQSGLQLVVTSDTIRGKATRGVQGN